MTLHYDPPIPDLIRISHLRRSHLAVEAPAREGTVVAARPGSLPLWQPFSLAMFSDGIAFEFSDKIAVPVSVCASSNHAGQSLDAKVK